MIGTDGRQTGTYPDGTTVNRVLGPDPRWGMRAPFATSVTVTTPGGKVHTTTTQRTVTLATPGDLLSLRTITETVTINGRVSTTVYDAPTRTLTHTSPTGRRTSAVVDDRGRPVQAQFGDLEPTSFTYDARGRLATATQGAGDQPHHDALPTEPTASSRRHRRARPNRGRSRTTPTAG